MAIFLGVVPWSEVSKACITLTRRGRTLVGGKFLSDRIPCGIPSKSPFPPCGYGGVSWSPWMQILTEQAEVLFDRLLLDGLTLHR